MKVKAVLRHPCLGLTKCKAFFISRPCNKISRGATFSRQKGVRHLTIGPQWDMQTTPTSQTLQLKAFTQNLPWAHHLELMAPPEALLHIHKLSLFPKRQCQPHPITLLEITGSKQDLVHRGTELLPTQLRCSAQNPQILNPAPQTGTAADAPCLPQAAGSHTFISAGAAKRHGRAGADKGSAGKAPRSDQRSRAHARGAQGTPR